MSYKNKRQAGRIGRQKSDKLLDMNREFYHKSILYNLHLFSISSLQGDLNKNNMLWNCLSLKKIDDYYLGFEYLV